MIFLVNTSIGFNQLVTDLKYISNLITIILHN